MTSVSSGGGISSTMQANTTFGFDDVMTANGPPGQLLQYSFNITIDGTMGLVAAQTALTGLGSFASSAFSTVGVSLNAQNEIAPYFLSLSQGICSNTLGCGTSGPGRIVVPAGTVQPVSTSLSGILTTPPGSVDFSLTLTNDSTAQGALAEYVCGSSICFTDLSASAGADFTSTALLTITALTAGASFTTASGALYGPAPSTVPLPTALPLFASGLVGLLLLGWRRKKKAVAL